MVMGTKRVRVDVTEIRLGLHCLQLIHYSSKPFSQNFSKTSHMQSNTIIYKIYIIHIFSRIETFEALTNIGKSLGRTSCSTIRTARVEIISTYHQSKPRPQI